MNTDMPTTIKEWGILYLRLTIVGCKGTHGLIIVYA